MSAWRDVAKACGTDKWTHTYMHLYERYLGPLAPLPITLLEIGVGEGNYLRLWQTLFPKGEIHGLDYRDMKVHENERTHTHRRFQQDPALASYFGEKKFDVIVDDGSHLWCHQRDSCDILWPCLKPGGYYFVEDILLDVYPLERFHWVNDPQCVWFEANQKDVFGAYCRSDVIAVLRKTRDREPHPMWGLYHATLAHPRWPEFFHAMEAKAAQPFTARNADQTEWDWLQRASYWKPLWERFKEGVAP